MAFLTKPDSLVARIFKVKYFPMTTFLKAQLGAYPSYVWQSIFAARKMLKDGVDWRVGTRFEILTDGFQNGLGKIHNTIIIDSVDKVSDLITLNLKRWNEEVLTNVFSREDATTIRCVPLSLLVKDDRLIWVGDRTTEYAIRSGYKTLIGQHTIDNNATDTIEIYKKIWQQKIPSKIKITS
ncbi:hypothetical protein CXB51_009520 [Gossypium anomalum]|uniref:Uncharacterized protein n=1 Tax=Gossypium anomalum TaxID=47600 RepID=A0A8J6D9H6_9ROSI|nr:hypothetical protein CXB51_009520 [Gossypium anomalum]